MNKELLMKLMDLNSFSAETRLNMLFDILNDSPKLPYIEHFINYPSRSSEAKVVAICTHFTFAQRVAPNLDGIEFIIKSRKDKPDWNWEEAKQFIPIVEKIRAEKYAVNFKYEDEFVAWYDPFADIMSTFSLEHKGFKIREFKDVFTPKDL